MESWLTEVATCGGPSDGTENVGQSSLGSNQSSTPTIAMRRGYEVSFKGILSPWRSAPFLQARCHPGIRGKLNGGQLLLAQAKALELPSA